MSVSQAVDAVRRFSRFYTCRLGVLEEGLLGTRLGLPEARLLYEIGTNAPVAARDLAAALRLDPGYVSRLLKGLAREGLIVRRPSGRDGRKNLIEPSEAGRALFAELDGRSREEVADLLAPLSEGERARLAEALETVTGLLGEGRASPEPWLIRPHRPGDIGWVVSRHGALYAEEYGWDISFEAMVADIASAFLTEFDAEREICLMAEMAGRPVGSVFVVRARGKDDDTARLRLLLVDPVARGTGLGLRLVEEAMRFAKGAGYRRMALWTNDCLHAARHIYVKTGFTRTGAKPHRSFGQNLVGETWEREL